MEYTLKANTVIDAPAAAVFERITDLDHLPDWNTEIRRVIERPPAVQVGAQWLVRIKAMGNGWDSRSTALVIDPEHGRFAYRSQTDDGNPSYAEWRWQLSPDPAGTRVDVEVDIRPRTSARRYVLSGMRRPSLHRAMRRSLDALDHVLTTTDERERA